MKMVCDRCHRPLQHAVELAGMKLGRECRRAIVDAVLQPQQVVGPEPHPDQLDFFRASDLFGQAAPYQRVIRT